MLILSSCGPLSFLPSGPNVAANVQAGAENRQALLSNELGDSAGRDIVTKEIETGSIDNLTVKNENIPPWVILLLLIGWLLPTPNEMARWVYKLFGKEI